jgi:transcriptional regulator GlxA family with amidase domain
MPTRQAIFLCHGFAAVAGMSERTLHRRFVTLIGQPPARYVENVRMDRARLLLEQGQSIKQVTAHIGYKHEQGFRAVFEAQFSLSPSLHKRLYRTTLPT